MDARINPQVPPSGTGCGDCDQAGTWWFHLRRCATCGHIGCCDTSLSQHARRHWEATGHTVMRSFEPGEDWFWDFAAEVYLDGVELAPPESHPDNQPVPSPTDRLPADWRAIIAARLAQ